MTPMQKEIARVRAQLKELHGAKIIVGVQGEPGKNFHGQTVAASEELQKIAWVHEYGIDIDVTPAMRAWLHYNGIHLKAETTKIHIPERSYIRRAHAEGQADFRRAFSDLIGRMMAGEISADEVLDLLGKQAMTDTYSNIGEGTKPISKFTRERRPNPNPSPLIDKGTMAQHITYRIEKKGGSG